MRLEAATAYGCAKVFAVKGNHDSSAPFPEPIVDLHLAVMEFGGLRFGGFNGSWKYKRRGHFLYDQWEADKMLAAFPPADILMSHNSPRGVHDRDDDVHIGFDALITYRTRLLGGQCFSMPFRLHESRKSHFFSESRRSRAMK